MPAFAKEIAFSHWLSAVPSCDILILSHSFCVGSPNVLFPVSLPMSVYTNGLVLFSYTENCLKINSIVWRFTCMCFVRDQNILAHKCIHLSY